MSAGAVQSGADGGDAGGAVAAAATDAAGGEAAGTTTGEKRMLTPKRRRKGGENNPQSLSAVTESVPTDGASASSMEAGASVPAVDASTSVPTAGASASSTEAVDAKQVGIAHFMVAISTRCSLDPSMPTAHGVAAKTAELLTHSIAGTWAAAAPGAAAASGKALRRTISSPTRRKALRRTASTPTRRKASTPTRRKTACADAVAPELSGAACAAAGAPELGGTASAAAAEPELSGAASAAAAEPAVGGSVEMKDAEWVVVEEVPMQIVQRVPDKCDDTECGGGGGCVETKSPVEAEHSRVPCHSDEVQQQYKVCDTLPIADGASAASSSCATSLLDDLGITASGTLSSQRSPLRAVYQVTCVTWMDWVRHTYTYM